MAPGPNEPAPRNRRKGLIAGVIGVASVALIAGAGVFAWAKLSGGGPQPAEAIPADAVGYVRLDLDPSAEQKLNAMSLLGKWPEFEESTGISKDDADLRKLFIERALPADECGIDYGDDVEPWIGDRLGLAVVPGDEEPTPLVTVQVEDQDKAEKGAEKIADCVGTIGGSAPLPETSTDLASAQPGTTAATNVSASSGTEIGVAFSGDYMIVAPTQDLADTASSDAEDASLASDDAFKQDMEALGEKGIASIWFDGKGLADIAPQMGASPDDVEAFESGTVTSGAAALRAGDDYLEFVAAVDGKIATGGKTSDVGDLPESTLGAVSISNGKSNIEKAWPQLMAGIARTDPGMEYMLEDFESQTGLSLPEDLGTLLGEKAMLAVDGGGLASGSEPESLSDVDAGMKLTSDPDEVRPVVDKVLALASQGVGTDLADKIVTEETDGGMVLATNDDYASALREDGGLGDTDVYQTAVPAGDDAVNVVYVNMDRAAKIAASNGEDVEPIEPLEAVGLSSSNDDGRAVATLRVTFD